MKKLLSVLLAVCLLFTAFPLTAFAAESGSGAVGDMPTSGTTGDCTWSLNTSTGVLTVSGSGATASYSYSEDNPLVEKFEDEETLEFHSVTEYVTSIIIEEGVTSIGQNAFCQMDKAVSVSLPSSLKTIGSRAFSNCKSLTSVLLPDTLEAVKNSAFFNTGLTSVTVPESVTEIGEFAFGYCEDEDHDPTEVTDFTICGKAGSKAEAYADENGFNFEETSVEPIGGETGACTWVFDEATGTLTVSGNGAMADYYDSTAVPWFQYAGKIRYIEVEEGVTAIGDSAFAYIGGIGYVWLPDSLQAIGSEAFRGSSLTGVNIPEGVKTIGARAFQSCKKLAYATLPESLQSIGLMAFGDTALKGIEVLNRNTQIGFYAFGFDVNGKKTDGFTVEGYSGSTANSYANSNGFTFIDLDAPQHALRVYMGNAFNVVTGDYVTKARAGERIRIVQRPAPYVMINGYSADGVTFEKVDGNWYFTMPDHSLIVYLDYKKAAPIHIDFSKNDSVALSTQEYLFLTVNSTILDGCLTSTDSDSGAYTFDLDQDGSDDVRIERYRAIKLSTASIAKSVSFSEDGADYSPVTFLFEDNAIDRAELYLELPNAGDSYDYEIDSADVTTDDGRFTVVNAKWYNEWGIAPAKFEGGQKYYVEVTLRPTEGYAFFADTMVLVDGTGVTTGNSVTVYDMNSNGDLRGYTAAMYIPGEAHAVHVVGGMAVAQEGEYDIFQKLSEAKAGEKVWLSVSTDDIPEDYYAVTNTIRYHTDDAIIEGEAQQYFIMPDEDVEVEITFNTAKQMNGVMDISNGKIYETETAGNSPEDYYKSQAYGINVILFDLSAKWKYEMYEPLGKEIDQYDIDDDGSFDIGHFDNEYLLLNTSSLSDPTGQITLRFARADCLQFPMRSLTIIYAEPTVKKHKLTLDNCIASSAAGDYSGNHRIYEAYPGEYVYLLPDGSKLNNEFVVQRSFEAVSDDVAIYSEGETFFVMPDKDVAVSATFETRPLMEGFMDLSDGAYTADNNQGGLYAVSEDYGMYFALMVLAYRVTDEWDEAMHNFTYKFDIDNYGGYDIGYDFNAHTFTLLDENSLRPASGIITLRLPASEYFTVPMHELNILLVPDKTKYNINVTGGFASAYDGTDDYLITGQYPGYSVYIRPDFSQIPEGKYIINMTAAPDVPEDLIESADCFVMPEHDVNVTVTYELGDQEPFTLDFSSRDTVSCTTQEQFNDVCRSLKECAAISDSYKVEDFSFVKYDLDGDGRFDLSADLLMNTIRLLHHEREGVETLTAEKAVAKYLHYYPITVVYSANTLKGDVNNDGRVDISDATALQRYLAEYADAWLDVTNEKVLFVCDNNDDGKVNVADVTALQRQLAEF